MSSFLSKSIFKWSVIVIALVLIIGCLGYIIFTKPAKDNISVTPNSNNVGMQNDDSQKRLISDIFRLASQGRVINNQFTSSKTNIEDVKQVWGEPDKSEYVREAKGTYVTYEKYATVFGFNKGMQIFEIRISNNEIKELTLSKIKASLGNPDMTKHFINQEIIGYKAGTEYKLEFVFPQPTKINPDPAVDHINVLYPDGTVNSMADDPGRQW